MLLQIILYWIIQSMFSQSEKILLVLYVYVVSPFVLKCPYCLIQFKIMIIFLFDIQHKYRGRVAECGIQAVLVSINILACTVKASWTRDGKLQGGWYVFRKSLIYSRTRPQSALFSRHSCTPLLYIHCTTSQPRNRILSN